jgi:membrane associated rhomboid family serine protease
MLEIRRPDGTITELDFEAFEEAVQAGRIGPETPVRFPPVTGGRFVAAGELESYRSLVDHPRARFRRSFDLRRIPRVTALMAVLLAAVFVWQTRQSAGLNGPALILQGAKSMPHQVELGEWWRLLSASLLHSGWLHLIPNLAFLFYVGWNVETILGAAGMALLLVAAGLGSMTVSSLASDAATVGASGLTFAVFGAAIALGWRYADWLPHRFRARYGWPMVPFVVYFLAVGMMWPTIDNFCHVGGLVVGGALGLVLPAALEETDKQWPRRAMRLASAALLVLLVTVAMPLAWRSGVLPGARPRPEPVLAGEAGYSLQPPAGWEPLGRSGRGPGWRSPTGQGQLTARAWIEELEVPSDEEVRRRWVEELEESASVVPRSSPPPASIGLPEAWFTLECDVVAGEQLLRSLRVGVVRGLYVTTLEFLHPVDRYDAYARLREAVFATVRLEEPRTVVRALEALHGGALADPEAVERAMDAVPARVAGSPAEALRLVAELARYGEGERARHLLGALGASGAQGAELLYWDLWIDHHLAGVVRPDVAERARELAASQPDSLPAAALAFDLLLRAERNDEARAVLWRMQERWPERLPVLERSARLPPQ